MKLVYGISQELKSETEKKSLKNENRIGSVGIRESEIGYTYLYLSGEV